MSDVVDAASPLPYTLVNLELDDVTLDSCIHFRYLSEIGEEFEYTIVVEMMDEKYVGGTHPKKLGSVGDFFMFLRSRMFDVEREDYDRVVEFRTELSPIHPDVERLAEMTEAEEYVYLHGYDC